MTSRGSNITLPNSIDHQTPTDMAVVDVEVHAAPTPLLPRKTLRSSKSPEEVVRSAREAFNSGKTKSLQFRETQLKNLMRMYQENEATMIDVLAKDLRKHPLESCSYEIEFVKNDLISLLMNFKEWAEPEYQEKEIKYLLEQIAIYKDPYGVVLVIGAWNYPIQLTLLPIAGAIAAGNCVIIKPPEMASHTSKFITETIPKYLDRECYQVVEGGVQETTELLKQRFDYIFFTGSPAVGRIIHQAATKHLTPTTLELGGKSPVYVDSSADVEVAAKRTIWGKVINAGQTCIAPDYLLCTKETGAAFIRYAKKHLLEFYGSDAKKSKDFCRIVNQRHFDRLVGLIKSNKVAIGGHFDAKELYIEPTVLIDVNPNDPVMQEEIFGPILPVVKVSGVDEAIAFINSREKPLALYIFSNDNKVTHIVAEKLPFGGVGNSGMGNYHGRRSFDTFVHKKSVLKKPLNALLEKIHYIRYPPYTDANLAMMKMYMKTRRGVPSKYFLYLLIFFFGMMCAYGIQYIFGDA